MSRYSHHRHVALVAAAFAAAAPLITACSQEVGEGAAAPAAATTELGPQPTVEILAAKAGCTPKIQVDADELRTGFCETEIGKFFLTTFTAQEHKDAWMDRAPEYNPHLVGNLWTALADRPVLDRLREKIGGDLHLTDHRVSATPR